jgi:hypothetical protein
MKLATVMALVTLLSAGYAFAGGGAPVPPVPEGGAPSGRPSAVLDEAKCDSIWNMTEREGEILSEGKAAPFIVNFKMIDTDRDGWITQNEFKQGCKNGWVQEKSATGSQSPTGTEPPKAPPKVPKE